ncbi:nuclear transport factor 2 family protein [bacterium SCSIO 12741]|nr:nuclear transport factor 2 family protein [bacterium SCSIO 12741]
MEKHEILNAAQSYPLAFQKMDTDLIDNQFTKDATKTGFIYDHENKKWLDVSTVGIAEIKEWVVTFNQDNIMPDTPRTMNILDAQDRTAVVKLEMEWSQGLKGCDYINLIKEDGQWKIQTIVYQSIL